MVENKARSSRPRKAPNYIYLALCACQLIYCKLEEAGHVTLGASVSVMIHDMLCPISYINDISLFASNQKFLKKCEEISKIMFCISILISIHVIEDY
jgi:hypothetical protein